MTCVVSPRQHRMSFNSSSSSSSTHSQSHPHQQHASTSAADEEDLLALLGSDTFSLESQRDRDLIKLGSFLSNLIPPPHSSNTSSQPVLSPSTNHFGSPMSFQSSSSGFSQSHLPPAPSSSLNNKPSSMIPPAEFFQGMDFSSFNGFGGWGKECEGLKGGVKESFNQDRWGIGSGSGTPVGGRSGGATPTRRRRSSNLGDGSQMWRAPNCSREREERIEVKEAEEGGWKGRLRKSTVDQQQPGSGYSSPARRGQQSVREQQVEEEEQRRRNSRNYGGSDVDDGGGGREGDGGQEMEEDDLMMDD